MTLKGGPTVRRLLDLLFPPARSRRQRRLLAELANRPRPPAQPAPSPPPVRRSPNGGAYYRSVSRRTISPGQVRDRCFPDRARRGFDPREVREFLHLVADELAALRAELDTTQDENVRIKQALRDWQSAQFRAEVPA